MTPYQINILLWYYVRPIEWTEPSPILQETLDAFVTCGLLTELGQQNEHGARYEATDRLRCYAGALQDVPLPTWQVVWPSI